MFDLIKKIAKVVMLSASGAIGSAFFTWMLPAPFPMAGYWIAFGLLAREFWKEKYHVLHRL